MVLHKERLDAFEKMLSDIQKQAQYEIAKMEELKAAGKENKAGKCYSRGETENLISDICI